MKWLKYFLLVLFHPVDTFYLIKKDRKHISKLAILIMLALAVGVKILYVYTVNFTVSSTSPQDANALLELGVVVIPIVLWSIASYALMTICSGEATFGETFAISVYSLAPYIVCKPIMILISHMFSRSELGFFVGMNTAIIVWVVVLLFVGFMQANGLKFSRALGLGLVSIIVMALIAVTVLLAAGLFAQIVKFVQELIAEVKYLLR